MADGYVFEVHDDFGNRFYNYVVWEPVEQNAIDAVKNHSAMTKVKKLKDLSAADLAGIKTNLLLGAGIEFNQGNFVLLSHR